MKNMKRKKWLIPILIIVAILLVCVLMVGTLISKGYGASTGLYLESKDGAAILICNNSPIVMASNHNGDMFYNLDVGDRIFVIHTGIEESYPGQTTARAVFKLSSGNADDIPDAVIDSLIELGWLDPASANWNPQDNQILTLSFELNGQTHVYNIEYDSDNMIVKVDNTDYYDFLEDGELITEVSVLDTELTDYFVRNGGKSKWYTES